MKAAGPGNAVSRSQAGHPDREIETIVARLASLRVDTPAIFNPYADRDCAVDRFDAPAVRRANLGRYLGAVASAGAGDLWLGEAPSWRGGRLSGVPFVGESDLERLSRLLAIDPPLEKATRNDHLPASPTGTARAIWSQLPARLPVFWNAVLHHPVGVAGARSNRRPSIGEIRLHQPILKDVLALFGISRVIAIGRCAERAARDLRVETVYVRHPAQGGASEFRSRMKELACGCAAHSAH